MRSSHKFLEPEPIEMQSSPVIMVLPLTVTPVEASMWMPSVLGLELGALIFTFLTTTLLQLSIAICIVWLFMDLNPLTTTLLHQNNDTDWIYKYRDICYLCLAELGIMYIYIICVCPCTIYIYVPLLLPCNSFRISCIANTHVPSRPLFHRRQKGRWP